MVRREAFKTVTFAMATLSVCLALDGTRTSLAQAPYQPGTSQPGRTPQPGAIFPPGIGGRYQPGGAPQPGATFPPGIGGLYQSGGAPQPTYESGGASLPGATYQSGGASLPGATNQPGVGGTYQPGATSRPGTR
jgi:hypothetical protein